MWHGRTRDIVRPPIARINRLARRLAEQGTDLINLGQAILGLPPPDDALKAVRERLEAPGTHVYSPDPGLEPVLERTAAFLRETKRIQEARADRLMLTCGASQAFANALLTVTNPGDEVVVLSPYYFDHVFAIQLAGCTPLEVPLGVERDRFFVDLSRLSEALSPGTRCLVLVSPGNPTGFLASKEEVEALVDLCVQRDIWLISDETYDLLTYPSARHVSPAAVGPGDRVCVVGSFSKTLGLAGWRIGYLYGPADMVEEAIKVQDALVVCAPVPAQMALAGALGTIDRFTQLAVRELGRRRQAMLRVLESSGLFEPYPPLGGTFVFARLRTGEDSVTFCTHLLEQTGIVTVPGAAFGPHGEGHVRVSFGNQPVERIEEAGERLAHYQPRRG